ncbi:MAG: phytanoyl-CoA dioxygenase family protein [bacterium]|nr:phytanoyl-CoA dioxygenase family protein [bacterium]
MLPEFALSDTERASGQVNAALVDEAVRKFASQGTLILRNAFDPALIQGMHDAFIARNQRYLEDKDHADALNVGDKRFMITPEFEPPFDSPDVWANPTVTAIIKRLLTDQVILGSFGAVVSLPGAEDQHIHTDFPGLFPESMLDAMLPPFAVTVVIPLVQITELTGSTRVWPTSHRLPREKFRAVDPVGPLMAMGDCLFMDYRLVHQGAGNRSPAPRPILYNVYYRPWFRDHENYAKQARLKLSKDVYDRIPEAHRPMFVAALRG